MEISQKSRTFAIVIELERHIEILLLNNDCVIVPDLGGFMTHHLEARFDDEDNMFLPPQRTLGFNPQLKLNDSVLAQSYVEAYDIGYPEAIRRIEAEVGELKQHLANDGYYELNDIGRLSVNKEGKLEFEPCEAGILTPELYGLSSFEMTPLKKTVKKRRLRLFGKKHKVHQEKTEEYAVQEQQDSEHEGHAITIKMSWIRNTVAIAAALLAYFTITPSVGNHEEASVTKSQINLPLIGSGNNQTEDILDEAAVQEVLTKHDTADFQAVSEDTVSHSLTEEDITFDDPSTETETKTGTETKIETASEKVQQAAPAFCIVLASQVSQAGADDFVKRLQKQGYADARVYIYNKVRRVVCGNYANEGEAREHLLLIHQNDELKDAWLYKMTD